MGNSPGSRRRAATESFSSRGRERERTTTMKEVKLESPPYKKSVSTPESGTTTSTQTRIKREAGGIVRGVSANGTASGVKGGTSASNIHGASESIVGKASTGAIEGASVNTVSSAPGITKESKAGVNQHNSMESHDLDVHAPLLHESFHLEENENELMTDWDEVIKHSKVLGVFLEKKKMTKKPKYQWYQNGAVVAASFQLRPPEERGKLTATICKKYCVIYVGGEVYWECHLVNSVIPERSKLLERETRGELKLIKAESLYWYEFEDVHALPLHKGFHLEGKENKVLTNWDEVIEHSKTISVFLEKKKVMVQNMKQVTDSLKALNATFNSQLSLCDKDIVRLQETLQKQKEEREKWEMRASLLKQQVEEAKLIVDSQSQQLEETKVKLTEVLAQLKQERSYLVAMEKEKNLLEEELNLHQENTMMLEQNLIDERRENEIAVTEFQQREEQYQLQLEELRAESKKILEELEQQNSIKRHIIKNIEIVKSNIGEGSYGSVSLVRVANTPCVMKSLHDILLGRHNEEQVSEKQRSALIQKFYQECDILWKFHHPNIVQFMGIHYRGSGGDHHGEDLSLVMEYLPINLDDCITICNEEKRIIPLTIKLSILKEVTYGLTKLHQHDIIHRDLSASNVLLTPSLKPKIADFGVSKLITPSSALKFSMVPGAQYIMPPEAFEKDPSYSIKFDIFSLGITAIYLLLQEVPYPTNTALQSHHVSKKEIEIGKRETYITKMEANFKTMKPLVLNCLQDVPERRPTSESLTKQISVCVRQSGGDFCTDLTAFLSTSQVSRRLLTSPEDL